MSFQDAVAAFPIVSWAQDNLGKVRISESEIKADCPFCGGKRTLSINRNKILFCCHRCPVRNPEWHRKGCNLLQFLQLTGLTKGEAFRQIYALSGLPDAPAPPKRTDQPLIPPGAIRLSTLPPHEPARQYLEARGVGHLIETSYICVDGYYKDRIVLPCLERNVLKGSECKSIHKSITPKSLFHPPDQFEKSKTIYTTRVWNEESKRLVVTESILDAESFSGLENACGIYGSSLSAHQVEAILRLGVEELVWALDGDAHAKVLKAYRTYGADLFKNYMLPFKGTEDPNSCGANRLKEMLASPTLIESEWDLFQVALSCNVW